MWPKMAFIVLLSVAKKKASRNRTPDNNGSSVPVSCPLSLQVQAALHRRRAIMSCSAAFLLADCAGARGLIYGAAYD
jgi:hypothetical protein